MGFCLVLALAVSARELTKGRVHVPFHSGSRWGLLMRPVRSALHRSCSCGDRYGCFCWVWSWMSRRKLGISVSSIESLESFRTGHGQSQIQCRSESVARQRGHRLLVALACGSEVYRAYRDPSTFQPVMSLMIVARLAKESWCNFQILRVICSERP